MQVPLLDLTRQYKDIKDQIMSDITKIFEQQRFVLGDTVSNFEREFAEYCGTKFAVGCSSGTDALLMSLICAGIGKGDEVITTPFTFFATIETILRVGAKPVFVDIDEETFNIDTTRIEEKITDRTKAIMPVHIFGQMTNMRDIMNISKKHSLVVIEDAAQAVGAMWEGKKAGSIGDYGCFSFFPSKNLGCFGDGGAIVTNSYEDYEKLKSIRQHGLNSKVKYDHNILGGNFRLDAIQAAVLSVKLPHIDKWNKLRIENAKYYNQSLISAVKTPITSEGAYHVFNQYTIKVNNRDKLSEFLSSKGIQTAIYYPFSMSNRTAIPLEYQDNNLTVCNEVCTQVLSLPIFPELTQDEKNEVVSGIQEFLK